MTCAACAARIEKKLNRLDDVQAMVNFATERASVSTPAGVTPEMLIAVVKQTGYDAAEIRPRRRPQPTRPKRTAKAAAQIASAPITCGGG